jgi:multidrug efflux pump subunit AcrB
VLHFLGETINTMTLGGLALAVGILVDDSTVTIENTHRLRTEEGYNLAAATLQGSAGIAVPTLVSTLAISCVFTSVVFLEGPAKFLFTPLGYAVVFAMLASYGLSRTLTPITIGLLLKGEHHGASDGAARGFFARIHGAFERGFERLREAYVDVLRLLLARRFIVPIAAVLIVALGAVMLTLTGRDFFQPSTEGKSSFTFARPPAPASRRPKLFSRRSRTRFAKSFPSGSETSSSTTSAYPNVPITWRSPTVRPLAPMTA